VNVRVSISDLANRMSEAWPACSAPIVGTKPIVLLWNAGVSLAARKLLRDVCFFISPVKQ